MTLQPPLGHNHDGTTVRQSHLPDHDITPEFDEWLTTLDRMLANHDLDRGLFDAKTIEDEFEAGWGPVMASIRLRAARKEDEAS